MSKIHGNLLINIPTRTVYVKHSRDIIIRLNTARFWRRILAETSRSNHARDLTEARPRARDGAGSGGEGEG